MDTPNSIEKLNEFMRLSFEYKNKKDYDNALKYASLATISTDYPRADTCCQMGEIYICRNNFEWAKFWFEKAIGNIQVDDNGDKIDESFSTWLPMLRLSYVFYKIGDYEKANDMNNAVLLIAPNNEDALYNEFFLKDLISNANE